MSFDPKKTVIVIDGSSFLYRAYYGMRPLHTSKGVPVQAVYSFCRMIKKLMDTFKPHYMVLVWDSKGKTTRHEMYEEYKATREAPPSDLFQQKDYIVQFADLIGLAQLHKQGIEADDLIYSLALEWKKDGGDVIVVTTDKDMGQMLDAQTIMYDAFKEQRFDEQAFEAKMGFPVHKLPFYFALLGDTSDNIPGVRGIGEKGATELVQQFASLQDLYNNLDKVASKRARAALEANKDNAFLSEKLFLLQYHATGLQHADITFDSTHWIKARPLFEALEFKSFLSALGNTIPIEHKLASLSAYTFTAVTTHEQLKKVVNELQAASACALDTETNGIDPMRSTCVGISVCTHVGQAYYLPFGHQTGESQLSKEHIIAALKPLLEDLTYKKYLHNTKFDQHVLHGIGIELRGVVMDTMIVAYLLSQEWQRVGLKWLSQHFFNEIMLNYEDVVKKQKLEDFSFVPLAQATLYAAADAHQTLKLVHLLEKKLAAEPIIANFYATIEHPLIQVLYEMEQAGIHLDAPQLHTLSIEVTARLEAIKHSIIELLGNKYEELNLNSPKQIEQLLFYDLNLPPQKKSAKGTSYSTDQEVLEVLVPLHPVPGLILQYRELAKLLNTYIDVLPHYINPTTGNVHTTFSQIATATGRLASSDPNLQNIPADTSGYGLKIRAAFTAQHGYTFISADYSQIELRVLAHMSHDEHLTYAFMHDLDIHAETASRLFGVPLSEVTHEQRQIGKRINFSVLYGLTPFGLSKDLNIPYKQAKQYIDTYFEQYPGVSMWMESIVEGAKRDGYVTTMYGRRRYIPAIHEHNKALYEEARRIAINTPVQGTAADLMKLGMLKFDEMVKYHALDAQMLLQIHDELLISVRTDQLDQARELIRTTLEHVVAWSVPLKVTVRTGATWAEVTK